ncbi:hypothetical protein CERSUDRAFT_77275 [Gelatoporia subvermispora B]|uniref:Uncharacterized protein n=1 Tax=Ceriporiopsis subvermispora (strain B) TaxID=914234 RepID=M2R2U3_CERS8|nr:hypothetical protein CERSUDRAFT_77275 [Gelatoporia subvermispora B]
MSIAQAQMAMATAAVNSTQWANDLSGLSKSFQATFDGSNAIIEALTQVFGANHPVPSNLPGGGWNSVQNSVFGPSSAAEADANTLVKYCNEFNTLIAEMLAYHRSGPEDGSTGVFCAELMNNFTNTLNNTALTSITSPTAFSDFLSTLNSVAGAYQTALIQIESSEDANIQSVNNSIQTEQTNLNNANGELAGVSVAIGLIALADIGAMVAFPEAIPELLHAGADIIASEVDDLADAISQRSTAQTQLQNYQASKQTYLTQVDDVTQLKEMIKDYVTTVQQCQTAVGVFNGILAGLKQDVANALTWAQAGALTDPNVTSQYPPIAGYAATQSNLYSSLAQTLTTWGKGFVNPSE